MLSKRLFMCLMQLCLLVSSSAEDIISDNGSTNGSQAVLSRRKRYLVFPEGSSLQLVCEYVWPIVGQPNIWVLAISASLAWQLPSKPEHVRYLKKPTEDAEKRIDKISTIKHPTLLRPPLRHTNIPLNNNYYNGTWYDGMWYTKDRTYAYNKYDYQKKNKKYATSFYNQNNYFNHPVYTELHRLSRRELYPKMEQFFKAQRKDGKACLLRALCEVNRSPEGKGSFFQEIIKTVFRNKPSQIDEDLDEYDRAASQDGDCKELFSNCKYN